MNKLFPIYFLILLNSHLSFAQNKDIEWLKSINSSYTPTGGKIMKGFTHSINPISLGLPAGLLIGGIVKKDKEWLISLVVGVAGGGWGALYRSTVKRGCRRLL